MWPFAGQSHRRIAARRYRRPIIRGSTNNLQWKPDGFADLAFSIDAYDGSGHLMIGVGPPSNLLWNGVLWNAANTPVSGPDFFDNFVPGSYDVTIGNGTGVLTITNAPEPGMFALVVLGLICLGFAGIGRQPVSN
jgi:hypothetical protein